MARRWVVLVLWIPLLGFLIAAVLRTAEGRDLEGRFANSPLKPWFDQLRSRNGICCSSADGYVLEDPDWKSEKGHYRVRVPRAPYSTNMVWVDVPDDSVVKEPNKVGRTMVWPVYEWFGGDPEVEIRCFMPGSMT